MGRSSEAVRANEEQRSETTRHGPGLRAGEGPRGLLESDGSGRKRNYISRIGEHGEYEQVNPLTELRAARQAHDDNRHLTFADRQSSERGLACAVPSCSPLEVWSRSFGSGLGARLVLS